MRVLLVASIWGCLVSTAAAQSWRPSVAIEVGGGSSRFAMDDISGRPWGVAFDGRGRVIVRALSVAIGYRWARHLSADRESRWVSSGMSIDPRVALPELGRLQPFLEGN